MTRKSSTETLIAAMRVLARDIQSGDGVANAAISEAADRLEELQADHLRDATKMAEQQAHIAELERQAAIGRLAVKMLDEVQYSGGGVYCPDCGHAEPDGVWHGHSDACELDAILRDAEKVGMGVGE